jgi:probable rRNA maturation factor
VETKIQLFYNDVSFSLPNRNRLKLFIPNIFRLETAKSFGSLNYVFCTDEYLLKVNREFLQHDYYTDIITFDLSDPGGPVVGEIYISIDRVRENAKTNKVKLYQELHRVIFHGVLHLCGYRDKKSSDIRQMRAKENFYLEKYFKNTLNKAKHQ